jgi:hypothetical protein
MKVRIAKAAAVADPIPTSDASEVGAALVASDGNGNGCLLGHRGGWWHDLLEHQPSIGMLGLGLAPRGLSVWFGRLVGRELDGAFRPLLSGEVIALVAGLDFALGPVLESMREEPRPEPTTATVAKPARPVVAEKPRGRRCAACGELGHYAKTCGRPRVPSIDSARAAARAINDGTFPGISGATATVVDDHTVQLHSVEQGSTKLLR